MRRLATLLALLLPLSSGSAAAQTVSSRVRTAIVAAPQGRTFTRAELEALDISTLRRLVADESLDTLVAREMLISGLTTAELPTPQTVHQVIREPQWLGQTGLSFGDGTDPAVSLEIYRYWIGLGQDLELPFFLLGELPTLSGVDRDNLMASILDEYGGSLNVGIGTPEWRPSFGRFLSWSDGSPFGLHISARAGVKVLDVNAADEALDPQIAALGLGSVSAKLLLPVWADAGSRDPNDRAGSIQGELTATLQWSNNKNYLELFSEEDLLNKSLFYLNANVSLIITDYLYTSAGFTLDASEDRLERKTTLTFRYLK